MTPTEITSQLNEARRVLRSDPLLSIAVTQSLLSSSDLSIEDRIDALLIGSRAYIHTGQYDYGEPLAKQAAELSNVSNLRVLEGKAHNELGIYRFVNHDHNRALQEYQIAERLLKESVDPVDVARVYVNVANVYQHSGQVHESITMYELALELARAAGDLLIQGKVLVNLSGLYRTVVYDPETAFECMQSAEQIFTELGDTVGLAKVKSAMGMQYFSIGEYEESLRQYQEALQLRARGAEPSEMIMNYDGMIATLIKMGRVEEARAEFTTLQKLFANYTDDEILRGWLRAGEARVQLAEGSVLEALEAWDEVRQWLLVHGYEVTLIDLEEHIAQGLERIGEFESAARLLRNILTKRSTLARERAEARLSWFKARLELKQAKAEAEIERIRNVELATVVENMKVIHRENEQYVAFLAHELKSPLNTIRSISAMLAADEGVKSGEGTEFSREINRIASRMFDLINQTLEVSKQRQLRPISQTNARTIWEHLISAMRVVANEKQIEIQSSFDASEYAVASAEQPLVTIMENLLSNALKFAPSGSTVSVRVQRTGLPGRSANLLLSVKDEGPGISNDEMLKLFRPFETLTPRPTAKEDSTGLGLHLLQRTVDLLGGRVWCDSEIGRGTTFHVEIPLQSDEIAK